MVLTRAREASNPDSASSSQRAESTQQGPKLNRASPTAKCLGHRLENPLLSNGIRSYEEQSVWVPLELQPHEVVHLFQHLRGSGKEEVRWEPQNKESVARDRAEHTRTPRKIEG